MTGPDACTDPNCAVLDFDDDCTVDLADVAKFTAAFTAEQSIPGCDP